MNSRYPWWSLGTPEALRAVQADPHARESLEGAHPGSTQWEDGPLRLLASFERVLPLRQPSQLSGRTLGPQAAGAQDGGISGGSERCGPVPHLCRRDGRQERINDHVLAALGWVPLRAPPSRLSALFEHGLSGRLWPIHGKPYLDGASLVMVDAPDPGLWCGPAPPFTSGGRAVWSPLIRGAMRPSSGSSLLRQRPILPGSSAPRCVAIRASKGVWARRAATAVGVAWGVGYLAAAAALVAILSSLFTGRCGSLLSTAVAARLCDHLSRSSPAVVRPLCRL